MNNKNWKNILKKEFKKLYFIKLIEILKKEYKQHICYPEKKNIFSCFKTCKYDNLKVVIIGQDPYHGPNEANGLSFSVNYGQPIPKSLMNIFKEIKNEYKDFIIPQHGNLYNWAKQGVLLLNTILTVRHRQPKSHKNIGWEIFTKNIIKYISHDRTNLVFLLWGHEAKNMKNYIDKNKNHCILASSHPSSLSVKISFFKNNHFIKTNNFLKRNNIKTIKW